MIKTGNMLSSKFHWCSRIIVLSIIIAGIPDIQAQCDFSGDPPTVQCVDAPLNCLVNSCFMTADEEDLGWNGFCGSNTVINNPQYFEIIPIEDCIEIHIHVDNCDQGSTALQAALVTSCDWQPCPQNQVPCPDILDCDAGTGVGGTMVIDACGLTPGVSLWLVIDGSLGSHCQYTFTFLSGVGSPEIDSISQGDSILCASDGAIFYEWHQCADTTIIATTQCFLPESSGCYCVDMIFSECSVQACVDFLVSNNELNTDNDISIHPNPSRGILNIQLSENMQLPVSWELHDIQGIRLSKGILDEHDSQLNLESITAPGIYFLTVPGSENIFKLVIE